MRNVWLGNQEHFSEMGFTCDPDFLTRAFYSDSSLHESSHLCPSTPIRRLDPYCCTCQLMNEIHFPAQVTCKAIFKPVMKHDIKPTEYQSGSAVIFSFQQTCSMMTFQSWYFVGIILLKCNQRSHWGTITPPPSQTQTIRRTNMTLVCVLYRCQMPQPTCF